MNKECFYERKRVIFAFILYFVSIILITIFWNCRCVPQKTKVVMAYTSPQEVVTKVGSMVYDEEFTVVKDIFEDVLPLSDSEIDLLTLVTMAEAEGESDSGKRLVIDTILNRVDHPRFPNTVYDVVYQPNQFEAMWNGRINKCYVRDDIRNLVIEEMQNRTNYDTVFFRTGRYSSYGTPMFKVGNHYFSKY
jgi:N-acetylmuramoyl-L-alanine amidase